MSNFFFTSKTRTIIQWEFTQRVISKGFLFSVIFIPAIILAFTLLPVFFANSNGNRIFSVGVFDATRRLGEDLSSKLQDLTYSEIQLVPLASSNVEEALAEGKRLAKEDGIDAVLVLTVDMFTQRRIEIYTDNRTENAVQIELLKQAVASLLIEYRMRGKNFTHEEIQNITAPLQVDTYKLGSDHAASLQKYMTGIILVMMLYFAIANSAGSFMRGLSEEKNNRVIEVLVASASPREIMAGKVIGLGLVGLLQIAVWTTFAVMLGSRKEIAALSPELLLCFILYFVMGYMFFAGINALIGAVFASDQDIQPLQAVISMLGVVPVALAFWVIEAPSDIAIRILSYVPFLTPTMMILRIIVSNPPWWEIGLTFITLFVGVVLVFRMAGRLFEISLRMHGKKISLREMVRWARA